MLEYKLTQFEAVQVKLDRYCWESGKAGEKMTACQTLNPELNDCIVQGQTILSNAYGFEVSYESALFELVQRGLLSVIEDFSGSDEDRAFEYFMSENF